MPIHSATVVTRGQVEVLLVEDDPVVGSIMVRYLTEMGLSPHLTLNGEEALTFLATHTPGLACIDLTLPSISGFDLCYEIRKRPEWRQIPVLVVSARTAPQDRAEAEELGASDYLFKPFRRASFAQHVETLLARAECRPSPS